MSFIHLESTLYRRWFFGSSRNSYKTKIEPYLNIKINKAGKDLLVCFRSNIFRTGYVANLLKQVYSLGNIIGYKDKRGNYIEVKYNLSQFTSKIYKKPVILIKGR